MARLSQTAINAVVRKLKDESYGIIRQRKLEIEAEYRQKAEEMLSPAAKKLQAQLKRARARVDKLTEELDRAKPSQSERDKLNVAMGQAKDAVTDQFAAFLLQTELNLQLQGSEIDIEALLNDLRNIK